MHKYFHSAIFPWLGWRGEQGLRKQISFALKYLISSTLGCSLNFQKRSLEFNDF